MAKLLMANWPIAKWHMANWYVWQTDYGELTYGLEL